MRDLVVTAALLASAFIAHAQASSKGAMSRKAICGPECRAGNKNSALSCKLTSPELQQRKASVIAGLKKKLLSRKELKNGYLYRFEGSDEILDELLQFIKTERACSDFFVFNLSISGDKSEAFLEISGPEGVKDFIRSELAL